MILMWSWTLVQGVVYTMNHEVIPSPCIKIDWVVELVLGPFWFTPRKTCQSDPWSSRSPTDIFQGLHYPLTWSNNFCGGRGKRGVMVEKGKGPWHKNKNTMIFLGV